MKPTLVIMAAGMGSRYGGLKQIEPVGPYGEIIMDYSIFDAYRSGFGKVIFVIKKENEAIFKETIGSRYEDRIAVDYVYQSVDNIPAGFAVPRQRQKPWGTAHAVLSCKNAVDTPFAVINADDFYGSTSFAIASDFLRNKADASHYCMVGFLLGNTVTENGHVSRGVCEIDENNLLQRVVERTRIEKRNGKIMYADKRIESAEKNLSNAETWIELSAETTVSMNTWGFDVSIFDELENKFVSFLETNSSDLEKCEFFLPGVVDSIISEGKASVTVLASKEKWYGVTYKEDKNSVSDAILKLVDEGLYPKLR